ncbi:accessory Sec system glycosyltransferase GtfA [Pseudobutyrivibrio xylanivorans]|uniref:UDP-N-acetylglucosamine--peptide N-acetylglucosaminyltransferase GtfA subunit n=1 Tax=Pseudobutyrivibrio xylanivorans TaxID=185007 RepID=A0A1G5RW32_PSEXY|nr:accessory Sec system glycosyltransferase GtfA [Pseudobutyrivibrio xylanivorans]SCZ77940.1 accessory Sec system glycosylation protein GtfA [Pseudobutyrivibrio xylanivorans]
MIYNFNLGIGWASSGVEYAQSYRANILRKLNKPAKFIFTDMFPRDNLIDMTRNIGFEDDEIIWLYTFFTDFVPEPVTYELKDFKESIGHDEYTYEREGKIGRVIFGGSNNFFRIYFLNETEEKIHRVEMVSAGCLIRKDYFMSKRVFSEYYAPLDGKAHLYQRRFFNRDGSVAYEEAIDDDSVMYKFPDKLICSKEELIGYMTQRLNLTKNDIVIIDRATGQAQAILENSGEARIGVVIHADHFSEGSTDENYILWNNYYEYTFSMNRHIDFYITATDDQRTLLISQFEEYMGVTPTVYTIPVGSLTELMYPTEPRKKHSFITASRLATEKHVDWLVAAVVDARKRVPDISLDIYGKGGAEEELKKQIEKLGAEDYIKLMGQHVLTDVYKNYEGYLSASTSEGFGLTLMEAIGSGLPIIGFDVRYGNQNFIDQGLNGYKLPYLIGMERARRQEKLVQAIVKLCTEDDIEAFSKHSYEKAKQYLTEEVELKWKKLVEMK